MKNFVLLLSLMVSVLAYLGLCAYCIAATGSTAGLAGIGVAAITTASGVVAGYVRRNDKAQARRDDRD